MAYTLGLDIGITSVGWSLLDWERQRILDLGVRLFTGAETPKDGSSLAAPRREARSARRRTRRKAQRMRDVRKILVERNILTKEEMDNLFTGSSQLTPWELRTDGLDRLLTPKEFARVLIHIAKHRGFKSNRILSAEETESDAKAKEDGKANSSIKSNLALMEQAGYRTVGEMIRLDEKFSEHKRNKAGDYNNTIARSALEKEIGFLFAKQRELGCAFAEIGLERDYIEIFSRQLPFATGDMIEKLTGFCTLEPPHKRAPRAAWTAERFILLSQIVNLRVSVEGCEHPLTLEEMKKIEQLAYGKSKVTYKQIRSALDPDNIWVFTSLPYKKSGAGKDPEEKTVFAELKAFHKFRTAITKKLGKAYWENLISTSPQTMDILAAGLTFRKTDDDIKIYLEERSIEDKLIDAVLPLNFSGVVNLSIEAMSRLIPFMELGARYDEACVKAGYNHAKPGDTTERSLLLPHPDFEEIRNPVVFRALTQTRKVVNAIIRKYGPPEEIHIELTRDLSKSWTKRKEMYEDMQNNENEKKRLSEDFDKTFGRKPNSTDLLKYRLWKEQGGFCPYSGKYIDPNLAFMGEDGTYAEIDHIIPYSRSMDDSYLNKALVIGSENRNKKNQTPYEYLGQDAEKWDEFIARIDAAPYNKKKTERLKKRDFDEAESSEMKDRNLSDTSYISKYAANWMESSLCFANPSISKPVIRINGRATNALRSRWGINALKNREDSDLHHALDACVIAAATPAIIKRISDASRNYELGVIKRENNRGWRFRLYEPWPDFRKEVEARLSPAPAEKIKEFGLANYTEEELDELKPIFISRRPERKVTGPAHAETIRSARYLENGMTAVKTPLTKINLAKLENMVNKERDKDLYEDLKARLMEFGDKPEKAFKGEFRKRRKDGGPGPIVRSVKILSSGTAGVPVRNGIADNSKIARVDVYHKNGKFFLVPYYVDDIAKKLRKNRAIAAHKDESQWDVVDSTYEFRFSLFTNDLVHIVDGEKDILAYYRSIHRVTGSILVISDKISDEKSVGVKRAKIFEKYQVDVLGNYYKVKKEKPPYELA